VKVISVDLLFIKPVWMVGVDDGFDVRLEVRLEVDTDPDGMIEINELRAI